MHIKLEHKICLALEITKSLERSQGSTVRKRDTNNRRRRKKGNTGGGKNDGERLRARRRSG